MSFLIDAINPPQESPTKENQYKFDNGVFDAISSLAYISNPSIIVNANFATLGASGITPVTQANGDDAEWSSNWNVVGAGVSVYSLTSIPYPLGLIDNDSPSIIQTSSGYYEGVIISSYTGSGLYFYQRQSNTVRQYQKNFLTYGVLIRNNQNSVKKISMQVYSFYDGSSPDLQSDNTIYLQPGLNKITSRVKTMGLNGQTIGAGNYTEFRLSFQDLDDGTADLDLYQLKCEFGKISTLLNQ